jgi:drug/metabolite transporter (DMT)-like permease
LRQEVAMNRLAFLALTAAGVAWGFGFPLGKLALRETDAAHMVSLRLAVAAVVALPFALRRPEVRALFRSRVVVLGGVLYGLAFLVQFEALAHTSVTLAALLVGAMPALIAVCFRLLGEPVSRTSWAGVVAATAGAALIAGKPGQAGEPLGVGLAFVALLIFLSWLVVLRRAPKPATAMAIPAVTVIVGAATILPIALALHGPPNLDLSGVAWASIVVQGVVSTLIATAAWQYGLARVGSASAGVFINLEPLIGAGLGVALFGDQLTWSLAAGGLLIVAGSFVVVLGEKAPIPPPM